MLVSALGPSGDMTTVLSHHGSVAAAFGIHGLTAVLVALTGLLLIRERHTAGQGQIVDPVREPARGPGRTTP